MKLRMLLLLIALVAVQGCTSGTSPTTIAAASSVSILELDGDDGPRPTPLIAGSRDQRINVPGFDYCWQGVCADWFGTEVPTSVDVDTVTMPVRWIEGATLTASVLVNETRCPLPMISAGDGEWSLSMPEEPSTYRIDLWGEAPDGSSWFSIEVTTSAKGSPSAPVASVWWPVTGDQFQPFASAVGFNSGFDGILRVESADNVSHEFPLQASVHVERGSPIECGTAYDILWGDSPITFRFDEETLGEPPYEVTLTVGWKSPEYERTWTWPDDVDSEDTMTGPMSPTSGEAFYPHGDSDPLIDTDQ